MKPPKNWKQQALQTIVLFTLLTLAAWAIQTRIYNMTAPVSMESYALYTEAGEEIPLAPATFDWTGKIPTSLTNSSTINVILKNTGTTTISGPVTVLNISPTATITPTPNTITDLAPGANITITLTFTDLPAVTSISFQLKFGS